ncbi:unnamed protein product [Blepharisma stoltei]|uniref:Uncharacterized protein n=1 Tax=Blepharisma stoltei TaxID=1481888 RepID=A0AAU9JDM0_9CILI|nr:unnamed protein product [Blepharisma stoltei]
MNIESQLPSIKGLFKPDWMDCKAFKKQAKITYFIGKAGRKLEFANSSYVKKEFLTPKKKHIWDLRNEEDLELKRIKRRKNNKSFDIGNVKTKEKLPKIEMLKIAGSKWNSNVCIPVQVKERKIQGDIQSLKVRQKALDLIIGDQIIDVTKSLISKSSPTKSKNLQTEICENFQPSSSTRSFCCGWNDPLL